MGEINSDLVRVLMTLRNRAKDKNSSGRFSWGAVSSIMRKVNGEEYSYDQFQAIYDLHPMLQNIVSDFDERGVTLATSSTPPPESDDGGEANIQSTAKQAAKKTLDRP